MKSSYFKRFRMDADLAVRRGPSPLPAGYRFVAWNEALLDVHARTKFRSFRAEIDARVFPCLGDLEGCRRLMREIRGKSGFLAASTWLVVCNDAAGDLAWCGTIQGVVDRHGGGSIQNIGVVPAHRGRGLGSVLIEQALAGFRGHGLRKATLEVTASNSRAVQLYQRLGFRKVKTVYKIVADEPAAEPACMEADPADAFLVAEAACL
jgi:ribosomal protein S18 acetylase RimI-like enzyme